MTTFTASAAVAPLAGCSDSAPESRAEPSASARGSLSPAGQVASPSPRPTGPRPLCLGTYTSAEGGGRGIGLATYDATTGRITDRGILVETGDPSFLALHPNGRTLYAVNERGEGGVTAVRLADRRILGTRSSGGASPCHLSVHPSGRWLLSASYNSGSVAVHPIAASGALGERTGLVTHSSPPPGPDPDRQDGPHAHQIVTTPDGGHVLAVDLGTDTVYTYRLDQADGTLTEVSRASARPGAGSRHLTFHPNGRYTYLANELDNTVTVCGYDPATGRVTIGDPQSTGTGTVTSYPSQILVTANGSYAYFANRGHNSLTRYAIEEKGARLRFLDTVPVRGDWPRHTAFSPDGRLLFMANQLSSSVSVFHVDQRSGELRPAGEPFASPVAVCALPL